LPGQPGSPRESFCVWYARNGGPKATHEHVQSRTHKLHRDGRFHDLSIDRFEQSPLSRAKLDAAATAEAKRLQIALDQSANARPTHLNVVRRSPDKGRDPKE